MSSIEFHPLESSPEVFNQYLSILGVNDAEFVDVYGIDDDSLSFVPRPVYALLIVFSMSEAYETFRLKTDSNYTRPPTSACWSKQTITNFCGTMALVHALANGVPESKFDKHGSGYKLITSFRACPEPERSAFLEQNKELQQMHKTLSELGTSSISGNVDCHFVCLTRSGNDLVELDGRRKGPIVRVPNINSDDVLPASIKIVKEFLERESANFCFSILALVDKK